jgi:hypothetical protein
LVFSENHWRKVENKKPETGQSISIYIQG